MADPKLPPLEWVRCVAGRTLPSNDQPWGDLARWALAVREAATPFARCKFPWITPYSDRERKRIEKLKAACECNGCRLARLIGGDDEGG